MSTQPIPERPSGLYLTIDHSEKRQPFLLVDYHNSDELISYRQTDLLPRVPKEQTDYTPEQLEAARKLAQMVVEKMDKPNATVESEAPESLSIRLSERGAAAVKKLLEEHKTEWYEEMKIVFVPDGKDPVQVEQALRKHGYR